MRLLTARQRDYLLYLKTSHWRELRLEAFRKWGRACFKCGRGGWLEVHHVRYRFPWTTCGVEDVRPCCGECHKDEHDLTPEERREAERAARGRREMGRLLRKGGSSRRSTPLWRPGKFTGRFVARRRW